MEPVLRKKQTMERLTALCVCVAIAALIYIGQYLQQYYNHRSMSDNITQLYQNTLPTEESEITPPPAPVATASSASLTTIDKGEKEREMLLRAEEEGRERFEKFLDINGDFRGFLKIDGLLSQPLPYVQYTDNDKYLKTNFEGKSSDYGTIYLSAYNDRLLTNHNNIFFGHNMNNGSMFAPLLRYSDIKTWTKAPVIELDSLSGTTKWLVFAAYTCEPDYGYVDPTLQGEAFANLLDEIYSRSIFHTNIEVTEDDRIITLSTCNYEFQDARFAVHARMLREGEEIPEITVEKNPDRKPYNVPKQMELSKVAAKNMAVMRHPNSLKTYYYQIGDGCIEWYVGNTSKVQGIYTCFTGKFRADGELSAICEPDGKKTWIATDGLKDKKGIYLLSSRLPSGSFQQVGKAAVTPAGVDARRPLLALDGEQLWLLYSVAEADGEKLYRIPIKNGAAGGAPECLLTVQTGAGLRPVGMFKAGDNVMLLWQETKIGKWFGGWIGHEEITQLPMAQAYDKITLYGLPSNDKISMIMEKNGKLSTSSFNMSLVPSLQKPEPTPEVTETTPAEAPEEVIEPPEVTPVDVTEAMSTSPEVMVSAEAAAETERTDTES